jgi:hypothetical protein
VIRRKIQRLQTRGFRSTPICLCMRERGCVLVHVRVHVCVVHGGGPRITGGPPGPTQVYPAVHSAHPQCYWQSTQPSPSVPGGLPSTAPVVLAVYPAQPKCYWLSAQRSPALLVPTVCPAQPICYWLSAQRAVAQPSPNVSGSPPCPAQVLLLVCAAQP